MHNSSVNLALTIATGSPQWGQMALNWALSVKATAPEQKLALIYTPSAIEGIEPLIDAFFDYKHNAGGQGGSEESFHLKTQLYDIVNNFKREDGQSFSSYIYMDADTIILPGQNFNDYVTELAGPNLKKSKGNKAHFVAYCNDIYKFATGTRNREDYTFWCNPQEAKEYWHLSPNGSLPQFNTSFIFFRKSPEAALTFDKAKAVWADTGFKFQPYKGVKPDELCFNISSALLNSSLGQKTFLPHQVPFRPIFFQCFSETWSTEYMLANYRAMGFAGTETNPQYLIDFYNSTTAYYRESQGINVPFRLSNFLRITQDPNPIIPTPLRRVTITRAGDLPDSDGGAFNPSAGRVPGSGRTDIVIRKERNLDIYSGKYDTSAIPHIVRFLDEKQEASYELQMIGFPDGARLEDFRFIHGGEEQWISCSMVTEATTSNRQAQTVLCKVDGIQLVFHSVPKLPIETRKAEKNWVFFIDRDTMYCIYSLSPYRLFFSWKGDNYENWGWCKTSEVEQIIDFFHKGSFLCNSTSPILIGDHYLILFHTKESAIYYQGAALINTSTKCIDYYTRNSILIKHPSKGEGMHRGLIYVSAALYEPRNETINIYFGEGDSHSAFHQYDAKSFIASIIQNSTEMPTPLHLAPEGTFPKLAKTAIELGNTIKVAEDAREVFDKEVKISFSTPSNFPIKFQPFLLYLPDTEEWLSRWNKAKAHFAEAGLENVISIAGVHGQKFGVVGTHPYELDAPGSGHMIGQKYVASFLSMYVMYNVALHRETDTHFMFIEDDTRFNPDWQEQLNKALTDIPADFDFLFVGSCCAMNKNPQPVKPGSSVYKFAKTSGFPPNYPMGGNCYIIAKKCLEHIIRTQRDCYAPADISLAIHSFPGMDVYAILPRICEQEGNENLEH